MKHPRTSKAELWQSIIEFYQQLIDKYGWNQEPMLELAQWLSTSEYASWFYPSTSHQYLGISTVGTYPERCDVPMIFVGYEGVNKNFVIKYQNQHGKLFAKVECPAEGVETALSALMLRLKKETAT